MKLYGYRNGRTLRALWALEEVGAQYEYVEVDLFQSEGREPTFLALNPAGKVPVLDDGGLIITESAAICMHLAEKHPQSALLPPPATAERTACYKWVSFVITELDPPLWTIAKHRFALPAERRVPEVIKTASWEFKQAATILSTEIAGRRYLVANRFSVADILAGHTLLWARSAKQPLSESLTAYLEDLLARPAVSRARATPNAALLGISSRPQ